MKKKLLFIFFIAFTIIGCKETEKKPESFEFFKDKIWTKSRYVPVEEFEFDFDKDKLIDTLTVLKVENWNDPGDFQQINIRYGNGNSMKMYETVYWINFAKHYSEYLNQNQLQSENVLYEEFSSNKSLMVLFGYSFASTPGLLTIMDISVETPNVVFQKKFDVKKIIDLDNDGFKEIVGYYFYRESYGDYDSTSYIGTYGPYFVLKYQNETFETDTLLTEKYNQENYAGFYGLEYITDERFSILYPFAIYNSKPRFLFETYRKYPFTSLRKLEVKELTDYSKEELRIMRNEIFAFHGYSFNSEDLKEYFESLDWYKPTEDNDLSRMNNIEKYNVELIKEIEQKN